MRADHEHRIVTALSYIAQAVVVSSEMNAHRNVHEHVVWGFVIIRFLSFFQVAKQSFLGEGHSRTKMLLLLEQPSQS